MGHIMTEHDTDHASPEVEDRGFTVDPETAMQEFDRFIDAMDIDGDLDAMDDEDEDSFKRQRRVITRAIEQGRMVINEKGEAIYSPLSVSVADGKITFHEPIGADKMEVDRFKQGQGMHQTYAAMAAATKQPSKVYAKMRQRDLKVCEAVFALLFMG